MPVSQDKKWNQKFAKLVAFKREAGHCRAPSNRCSLGNWVRSQREAYRKNGKTLPGQRAARLEALGFEWEPGHSFGNAAGDVAWEGRCAELAAYRRRHGHCNVSRGPAHRHLGDWVHKQRGNYKRNGNTLLGQRASRLEALGFEWEPVPGLAVKWEGRFQELRRYTKEHGHCNVPRDPAHRHLGDWVNQQRRRCKEETLSLERAARLNDIGFAWTSRAPRPSTSSSGSHVPNAPTPKPRARAKGGTTRRRTSDPSDIEEPTDDERAVLETQLQEATTRISELTQQLAAASAETSELQHEARRAEATVSDLREDAASRTAETVRLRSSVQALTQELERARDGRVPADIEDGADSDAGFVPFIVTDWQRREPAARST